MGRATSEINVVAPSSAARRTPCKSLWVRLVHGCCVAVSSELCSLTPLVFRRRCDTCAEATGRKSPFLCSPTRLRARVRPHGLRTPHRPAPRSSAAPARRQWSVDPLASQQRATNARDNGYFDRSVVPVRDANGLVILEKDEFGNLIITKGKQ